MQLGEVLFGGGDGLVDAVLERAALEGDVQKRIQRPDVSTPEHPHHQRADDREGEGQAVPQRQAHNPAKILHAVPILGGLRKSG